jgi:hypothetical protein
MLIGKKKKKRRFNPDWSVAYGERIFVAKATCSSFFFFAKFENWNLMFQKNIDVDNDVVYQYVKF